MSRNEKIELILKVLAHYSEAWMKVTDEQLDDLLLIVDAYMKDDRVKELQKIITDAQTEIDKIAKAQAEKEAINGK